MKNNKYSILWCVTYYLVVGLIAVCQPFMFDPKSSADFLSQLVIALAPSYWLLNDSKKLNHFPHSLQPVFVSFWMFAVPLYLLWTRKWWGLLYVILNVACTILVSEIGYRLSVHFIWPVVFPTAGG